MQGEWWNEVYWICILHAGSCIQIQTGKPCSTLRYLMGLWPSCQHIICPDVVLTMTINGLMRAQIFPCDSDMKLKQPVPICSAIFRLLLCGGVYQRNFAKTYLLAKCFTIICLVHELKRTSLKRTHRRVTRISMEEVCPIDRAIQALHLTMRWELLLYPPSHFVSLCSRSFAKSVDKVRLCIRPIFSLVLALVCNSNLP